MSAQKVLLILGAGGNVGASVAKLFAHKGYKVALVARRLKDSINDEGQLEIQGDLAHPEAIESAFDKVTEKFGVPNVVVYNAAVAHLVPADDPLQLSVADFNEDNAVNIVGTLVASRRAVEGWNKLPADSPTKAFIYTGNFLNKEAMPRLMSNGIGKSASAHIMHVASTAYASKGYNFYFADERKADGSAAFVDISGPNHAKHYLDLAESTERRNWLQTFVGGKGYQEFP